jgi:hypothetical protein
VGTLREEVVMDALEEVRTLESQLTEAELGPDPEFFERALADDAVLVSEAGEPFRAKTRVVQAHRPGAGRKFKRVEMHDMKMVDHGAAVVVTCRGTFQTDSEPVTLKFMRVWLKRNGRWQIIAGSVSKA